ncbi:hypothetical protein NE237_016116 [Protea cynaroides]|uniref:Uncharacterized protein n=1 Tax=Protea cynaroides TaxID=273540 RepID=A0A9Q0QRK7_9MAGN|nr:hypothetical protein NE237_016116 [Protea cynaroides]
MAADGGAVNPVMVSATMDLGRFLGFLAMESAVNRIGSLSVTIPDPLVSVNRAGGQSRSARKHHRWMAREKDKKVAVPSEQVTAISDSPLVTSVPQASGKNNASGVGGRSFASVVSGLSDLNSLPDPIIEGDLPSKCNVCGSFGHSGTTCPQLVRADLPTEKGQQFTSPSDEDIMNKINDNVVRPEQVPNVGRWADVEDDVGTEEGEIDPHVSSNREARGYDPLVSDLGPQAGEKLSDNDGRLNLRMSRTISGL